LWPSDRYVYKDFDPLPKITPDKDLPKLEVSKLLFGNNITNPFDSNMMTNFAENKHHESRQIKSSNNPNQIALDDPIIQNLCDLCRECTGDFKLDNIDVQQTVIDINEDATSETS